MSDRERDKVIGDQETALLQVAPSRALLASIEAKRLLLMVGVEGVSAERAAAYSDPLPICHLSAFQHFFMTFTREHNSGMVMVFVKEPAVSQV